MNGQNCCDGLQLDNNKILHKQIDAIRDVDGQILISKRHSYLPLDAYGELSSS